MKEHSMKKYLSIYTLLSILVVIGTYATDKNAYIYLKLSQIKIHLPLFIFLLRFLFVGGILFFGGSFCFDKWCQEISKQHVKKDESGLSLDSETLRDLLRTITATTEGDMLQARKSLESLRKKIGQHVLADILELKILKGEKNFEAVEQLSEKLMNNKEVALVGLKALIETKEKDKHFTQALAIANKAFETRQDLYWIVENTFYLRVQACDWLGAVEVLEAAKSKDLILPEKYRCYKSIVLYEMAVKEKNTYIKKKHLIAANEMCPDFTVAAVKLAELYDKEGQKHKAEKILKKAWRENPNTEIADAYMKLYSQDTPQESISRIESLALLNTKLPSLNNYILADLNMKSGFYDKARSELELFLIANPLTKTTAKLIARFEKQAKKNKMGYDNWKKRAQDAADECLWVCSKCGATFPHWHASCKECGTFNSLKWLLCINKKIFKGKK